MARKGKGKEAKLSYNGNLLVENRHGLIVNTEVFEANGTAERDAARVMLEQIRGTKQVTVGGDKAYDTADFVAECRNLKRVFRMAEDDRADAEGSAPWHLQGGMTATRYNGLIHDFVLLNAIHDDPGVQAALQQINDAVREALKP